MNKIKDDLKLIDLAIEKWKDIVYHDKKDQGTNDCALCSKYYTGIYDTSCLGCPIYKYTDESQCSNTPHLDYRFTGYIKDANRMLSFLYELRLHHIRGNKDES